tara:strand:+ start:323 stop:517 length:195 start_codon:yes stop_codon:yes gene_type:complete
MARWGEIGMINREEYHRLLDEVESLREDVKRLGDENSEYCSIIRLLQSGVVRDSIDRKKVGVFE